MQQFQRAQRPHEPVEHARVHVQHAGHTDGAPGTVRQGIENAQLNPRIENLAAPSPENQVHDLCTGVIHNALHAQEMMPLLVHATYEFPFFPEVPSDGAPNNRFTGTFSSINPYSGRLFLLILSGRVLSGSFSGIITSAWGPFGVYQERFQPDICQTCRTRAV